MWSNSKVINTVLNILLFIVGINFLHYGQLILPIMCLIIFADNGFKFVIIDRCIFTVLVLFSISFFLFSYKNGFYSVMGFCLPMAYYIGSNVKNSNFECLKKVLYILSFGMACHMILNFLMEITFWYDDLSYLFNKSTHYDIWLQGPINTTATALNSVFLISIIYYIVFLEKNKMFKIIGILLFAITTVYNLAIGRRTTFFLMIVAICLPVLLKIVTGNEKVYIKKIIITVILICMISSFVFIFNILGIKDLLLKTSIVNRFIQRGLYSGRIEIFISSLKLMPKYLWGGQNITNELGAVIHNLAGDIYDYAGIIPCVLMIIYYIFTVRKYIILITRMELNDRILFTTWLACSISIMMLEPIMTGSSIFIICVLIVDGFFHEYKTK